MERKTFNYASLMFAVIALFASNAYAKSPIYVGVIENIQDQWNPGNQSEYVRVAFMKQGNKWVPMGSEPTSAGELQDAIHLFPIEVKWDVVFDGRKLGEIASKNPSSYKSYGDFGLQTITSAESTIPKIATEPGDFTYIAGINHARTRPLLVVSAPNYRDPQKWKLTNLSEAEHKVAIDEFRRKVPQMEHCYDPEGEKPKMIPYTNNQIVLVKAYRSISGELLYGERLDNPMSGCDSFDDDNYYDYWFAKIKNGTIHYLGTEMMPIDAADLDDNGSSEWVFHTSTGEDDEGYEIFYDDFSKTADFQWFYH